MKPRRSQKPPHLELGRKGERIAARKLRREGYRIIDRNVRFKFGEIDIVAQEGGDWVFIEVKTLSSIEFIVPEEQVRREKQLRIAKSAQAYLRRQDCEGDPYRFDIVSVVVPSGWFKRPRTRIIREAFPSPLRR